VAIFSFIAEKMDRCRSNHTAPSQIILTSSSFTFIPQKHVSFTNRISVSEQRGWSGKASNLYYWGAQFESLSRYGVLVVFFSLSKYMPEQDLNYDMTASFHILSHALRFSNPVHPKPYSMRHRQCRSVNGKYMNTPCTDSTMSRFFLETGWVLFVLHMK
jgi:hypothetical protein